MASLVFHFMNISTISLGFLGDLVIQNWRAPRSTSAVMRWSPVDAMNKAYNIPAFILLSNGRYTQQSIREFSVLPRIINHAMGPQSHAEAVCVSAHLFAELGVCSWRHTTLRGEGNPHEVASGWGKIWDRPRGEQCGDPKWKHLLEMGDSRCPIGIRRMSLWLCRHSLSK